MSYHHFVSANLVKKTQEIAPVNNYRFHTPQTGYIADLLEVRCALDTISVEEYKRLQDPNIQFGYGILFSVKFHMSHPTDWCKRSLLCNNIANEPNEMADKAIIEGEFHEKTTQSRPVFVKRDLVGRSLKNLRRYLAMCVSTELQAVRKSHPPVDQRAKPRAILETQILKESYVKEHYPEAINGLEKFEADIKQKRKDGNSIAIHYDYNLDLLKNMDKLFGLHFLQSPNDYVTTMDYIKIPILYDFEVEYVFP